MNQMPPDMIKHLKKILYLSVLINLAVFLFFSIGFIAVTEGQMRWYGGIFLMFFVCTHGWYRYGMNRMIQFFCITLVVAWSLETLSITTGFPFGRFIYSDKLGEKIGAVPIMIFPAYFFNGYLAWTMAGVFCGHRGTGIARKHLVVLPLIAAFLMVAWNACFDPIMSTLMGYWTWEAQGLYYGVPLTNFAGWLITVYLFFQVFALLLYRYSRDDEIAVGRYYWALIPVMYSIQGLPYFIYPFFRSQGGEIYQPMALVTVMIMFLPALLNMIALRNQDYRYVQHQAE